MRRGTGTGRARIRRGAREERRGGTGCEDCRHVARLTRMAGDGDACRGAWRKTEEEESEGLTGGPGGDFHFLFPFFFRAVTTSIA